MGIIYTLTYPLSIRQLSCRHKTIEVISPNE